MDQNEYQKYIAENKHKIQHPKQWMGYVPSRIESSDPRMRFLSQNVLFGRYTVSDGKPVIATALYEPDYTSAHIDTQGTLHCISMNYYNKLDNRAKIILKYSVSENSPGKYEAIKYFEDAQIGIATGGDNWERFFVQVSFLEFVNGEIVEYTDIKKSPMVTED